MTAFLRGRPPVEKAKMPMINVVAAMTHSTMA